MSSIYLVPIYLRNEQAMLTPLAYRLEGAFRVPVYVRPLWFDPELSFDSSRRQYNSTFMLSQLKNAPFGSPNKILGVTNVDLFIPVLTYVFGEAQLDGCAAVVSIYRLRNEAYGLPQDGELLRARLEKESIHELGHAFGLVHCPDATCVMRSSTYVEEIDLKSRHFCTDCLLEMRNGKSKRRWNGKSKGGPWTVD